MKFIRTLAAASIAAAATAGSLQAQTNVQGSTLGCFGAACSPGATSSFMFGTGSSLQFTGQAFNENTVSVPSGPFTEVASVSNFGLFDVTVGAAGGSFTTPFTLQYVFTQPGTVTPNPLITTTVSGTVSSNGQAIFYDGGNTGQFTFSNDRIGFASFSDGAIGNTNSATIQGLVRIGDTTTVPEPSTYALMAAGLAGLGLVARRRQRNA